MPYCSVNSFVNINFQGHGESLVRIISIPSHPMFRHGWTQECYVNQRKEEKRNNIVVGLAVAPLHKRRTTAWRDSNLHKSTHQIKQWYQYTFNRKLHVAKTLGVVNPPTKTSSISPHAAEFLSACCMYDSNGRDDSIKVQAVACTRQKWNQTPSSASGITTVRV